MAAQSQANNHPLSQIPEINRLAESADHIDIKVAESDLPLREFVARLLSYQPTWVTALYGIRWGFVRLLGLKQQGIPQARQMSAEELPMSSDKDSQFLIFRVISAKEDAYWFAQASESHLSAILGVSCERLADGRNRFYVVTLVHYHRWTGRVYFNTIRPFHHLVVGAMMNHAAQA